MPKTRIRIGPVRSSLGVIALTLLCTTAAHAEVPQAYSGNVTGCDGGTFPMYAGTPAWNGSEWVLPPDAQHVGDTRPGLVYLARPIQSSQYNYVFDAPADEYRLAPRAAQCLPESLPRGYVATSDGDVPNTRVEGTIAPHHLRAANERLANVSLEATRRFDGMYGWGTLFSGGLTSVPGFENLAALPPDHDGRQWETVAGAGGGTNASHGFAARPSADFDGRGSGSNSVVLHELGHAVDEASSPATAESPGWRDGPFAEVQRCTSEPYERSDPAEWYAESFSMYFYSRAVNAYLRRLCPQTHAWHRQNTGAPRFRDDVVGRVYLVRTPGTRGRPRLVGSIRGRRVQKQVRHGSPVVARRMAGKWTRVRYRGAWYRTLDTFVDWSPREAVSKP